MGALDKIKSKLKFGWICLYVIVIGLTISFLSTYTSTDNQELLLTPMFQDNVGWDIYRLENNKKINITTQELFDSHGETFYLSRVLDNDMEQKGYTFLELDAKVWQCSVFLDNQLLYTVHPDIDNRIGHIEFPSDYQGMQIAGENVKISLPPNYAGKTLTIACAYSSGVQYKSMPMVMMSSENIQTLTTVTAANSISMPAVAYMMGAILLIGLFVYDLLMKKASYSILLLAIASFIQSLRTLLNFEFYFSSHFSLNFIPADLLIPLCVILPMIYLLINMKKWQKWFMWFLVIPSSLTILFHILARFETFAFLSLYRYDLLLYISLIALVVFAILEYFDNNKVYSLFTPVFLLIMVGIILTGISFMMTGEENHILATIVFHPLIMYYDVLRYCGDILLIISGVVTFLLTIKKTADTQSELSIMSVKNELMSENIQDIQKSSMEIAKLRHDMLRHLHTMQDLCLEDNSERLKDYLQELTKETEMILPVKVCDHPVINALITRALNKAEKNNIQMNLHVEVPIHISIADYDLCTLLMNMLDNAIEAVSTQEKRQIELTIHIRGHYLFIETINPYEGLLEIDKETGLCISHKGNGHGYGMKAMSDIAKKYNSILHIKQKENQVIIRTALLMPHN